MFKIILDLFGNSTTGGNFCGASLPGSSCRSTTLWSCVTHSLKNSSSLTSFQKGLFAFCYFTLMFCNTSIAAEKDSKSNFNFDKELSNVLSKDDNKKNNENNEKAKTNVSSDVKMELQLEGDVKKSTTLSGQDSKQNDSVIIDEKGDEKIIIKIEDNKNSDKKEAVSKDSSGLGVDDSKENKKLLNEVVGVEGVDKEGKIVKKKNYDGNFKDIFPKTKIDEYPYRTQQMPELIHRKVYDISNNHLPPAFYEEEYADLLVAAIYQDNIDGIRSLVEYRNMQLDDIYYKNEPILTYAVHSGNNNSIKILLNKGANPDAISPNTKLSGLHIAVVSGRADIVKTLLEEGANINITDQNGRTPLMYAIAKKDFFMSRLLLDNNANYNIIDVSGDNALSLAKRINARDIESLLVDRGVASLPNNKVYF